MQIYVCGLSFKTAAVEKREKMTFNREEYGFILKKIKSLPGIFGCALLTTCNRTEIYLHTVKDTFESNSVVRLVCNLKGVDFESFHTLFYFYSGTKAVKHIFRVACGLDSMVLCEDQILGQLKDAYSLSMEAGTTSAILNTLIRQAVTSAKKIKTQIGSIEDSVSVAELAIKQLLKIHQGSLEGKSALIIGMGKTGVLLLKHLLNSGAEKIFVTRRNHSDVCIPEEGAQRVNIIDYSERYNVLNECDVVISSTASPHFTLTGELVEQWVTDKVTKRFYLDLAVPRDMDQSARELAYIQYCDIDGLKSVSDNRRTDAKLIGISLMESIIDYDVMEFEKWYSYREALPIADEFRVKTEKLLCMKREDLIERLPNIKESEINIIDSWAKDMIDELLDRIIYSSREHVDKNDIRRYFSYLADSISS